MTCFLKPLALTSTCHGFHSAMDSSIIFAILVFPQASINWTFGGSTGKVHTLHSDPPRTTLKNLIVFFTVVTFKRKVLDLYTLLMRV